MPIVPLEPLPRPLIDIGRSKWAAFADAAAAEGVTLPGDAETVRDIRRVFVFSDYVARVCARHPQLMADLIESGDLYRPIPSGRLDTLLSGALENSRRLLQDGGGRTGNEGRPLIADIQKALRTVRRREMVRIAFRDLIGRADLSETIADLSGLADASLQHSLDLIYVLHCRRHGIPTGENGAPQAPVVIAMGKLGAMELNFSSDIDLIFAYPEAGQTRGGATAVDNNTFFTGLFRDLIKVIATNTADGIVFRVDLGLRPFGDSGPIAMNFDAMEDYYQSQGREWERYAWIKARAAAGDRSAGARLLERLKPFVYRRYLDYGVFESLREMKLMISREVRRRQMAGNIKLGPGGIREIEFFGQMFQLIRGGVVPSLQTRKIVAVLRALVAVDIIAPAVCETLVSAYRFLRHTEHRLQAFSDQQTHDLPTDPVHRDRLAAAMGVYPWKRFTGQLTSHMHAVHDHFSTLLDPADTDGRTPAPQTDLAKIWLGTADKATENKRLAAIGYDAPEAIPPLLESLRTASATRTLSPEGRKRLDLLVPMVITAAGRAEDPPSVLNSIIELIKTIEQRTSYLALLLENPATLDHLVRLAVASPWIVSFMAQHPVLLDELLDPRTLYRPPAREDLEVEIRKKLATIPPGDLEALIETLCIFKQVNTLRVAAADVSGHLPLMKVSDRLSWIAETILNQVVAFAWQEMVARHGYPDCAPDDASDGRGFAVIAYGKLGGLELGYDSDLDLVFLHAGGTEATRGGPRPIDTPQFFARLGQRIIHIFTAHTRAGKLYDTDMRLRPSGSSGPLVSQIDAFGDYQRHHAWTWENQAMVRARAVCGDPHLAERFSAIRRAVIERPRNRSDLAADVSRMRERLRQEHHRPEPGIFHLKQSRGAMVDIEFLAQYLVLLEAGEHPALTRWSDNVRILESLLETGIIDDHTAYRLKQAYLTYRATAHRLSLRNLPPTVPADRFARFRDSVVQLWQAWLG